jgi:hypothetical protein
LRTNLKFGALALSLALLSACRQDMHDQPKYIPLRPSDFFADGRSARPLIEGTVARGHLNDDTLLYTGKGADGKFSNEFPMPVTKALILRGEQRFNVYCTPCHDRTGSGNGMIVRRGYRRPPTYHSDRLRQQPNGYLFDVITNGFGAMPDYAAQVQPQDRWAIFLVLAPFFGFLLPVIFYFLDGLDSSKTFSLGFCLRATRGDK